MANTNGSKSGALSHAEIQELLAGSPSRGVYGKRFKQFAEDSDEAGVNVRTTWPSDFANKTATALVQSFTQARDKAGIDKERIAVIRSGEDVFLIHKERMEEASA